MRRKREMESVLWTGGGEGHRSKGVVVVVGMGRRQVVSFVLVCVLGLGVCLLCYSSFFPIRGGVVWNTPFGTKSSLISSISSLWPFRGGSTSSLTTEQMIIPPYYSAEEGRRCHFPILDPYEATIRDYIHEPPSVDCAAHYALRFRSDFGSVLFPVVVQEGHNNNDTSPLNETCCYKVISRDKESDHNVKYSKMCHPLNLNNPTEIPPDHEFISIKCTKPTVSNSTTKTVLPLLASSAAATTHKDMFAFVHLKPLVEARIKRYEEQRAHLTTSNSNSRDDERMNVLILGLDAQSHMNFIRQMPLTYAYVTTKLGGVGLQGYTKVGDNTFPNVIPLLSGLSVQQLKRVCWPNKSSFFDACPFVWKHFGASGYRTSFAEDSIWMGTFTYEKKGFLLPPTDYYLHPLTLLMAKKIGHETYGNAKLCYGPRLAFEVLLDYMVKMAVTMKNKHYFQYIWANSLFHDYLNHPKLGDELLHLSLEYLSSNGYLDNTLLLLISDHGIRWGSIRSTYQGKLEERMPMAYFIWPKWFSQKYKQEMHIFTQNAERRLTTPFDIHATLLHVLQIGTGRRVGVANNREFTGVSLLRPLDPARTCKAAGVEEHWCVCDVMKSVPKNSTIVLLAAKFIVREVNRQLSKYSSQCAKLDLHKINEAMRKIDGDVDIGVDLTNSSHNYSTTTTVVSSDSSKKTDDNSGREVQLQITLVTRPGDAVLEATVHGDLSGGGWTLSGEISRLNLYREQSHCVRDYLAQKYCFCIHHQGSKHEDTGGDDEQ